MSESSLLYIVCVSFFAPYLLGKEKLSDKGAMEKIKFLAKALDNLNSCSYAFPDDRKQIHFVVWDK